MKKSERRMILVLIIIAIAVIAGLVNIRNKSNNTDDVVDNQVIEENITQSQEVGEFVQVLEDGTKQNVSDKLAETKTFSNYEVSNIELREKDGKCEILADVKNIGTTKADVVLLDITLLDKDGNEIVTIGGIIGNVEPGQTVKLNSASTADFSNAYDFTIKISEQQ